MDHRGKPTFVPMPGKIVVRPLEEKSTSGITIVSDMHGNVAKTRSIGEVIAIGGDESEGEDWDLSVGDVVMYGMNSGVKAGLDEVREGGVRVRHEVIIFRTNEILCKVIWNIESEDTSPEGS